MCQQVKEIIYDCHLHIPMKKSNPIGALLNEINDSNVGGFVLILNSTEEENMYFEHLPLFDGYNHKVALILDVRSESCLNNFKVLEEKGIEYIVKIHPRISKITTDDFKIVREKLKSLSYHAIIIDGWIFGYQIENHVGTELAVYLARELPDKKVVIAHSGGYKIIETMLLTRPVENMYYDLSLTQLYFRGSSIEWDIDYFVKWMNKKIIFGSDYPDFDICEAWKAFRHHYHNVGLDDKIEKTAVLAQEVYGLQNIL